KFNSGETVVVDCGRQISVELLSSPRGTAGSVLLRNLRCGERVTVLSESNSWARISTENHEEGFAVLYFLSKDYSNSDTGKTAVSVVPAPATSADAKPKPPVLSGGTGFLVHPDGLLITAFHVVEASKKIEVRCGDLPPQIATLRTASSSTDLAVLRIPTRVENYLTFAPKKSATLGARVFSVGY